QKIEGLKRHTGVHAAGVVVTREELPKYAPLSVGAKKIVTTQYEGVILEKLGLLKMDFLGLRTLTVIDKAVEMVKKQHNIPLDISKIRLDDAKTYDLLKAGDTLGVFQLESRGMRDLVKALKPSQFSDISALVALYRPGPMQSGMLEVFVSRKHGRKKITYDHPLLEPILKETYGTLVYQEQVMEISKSLAGFTPGQSDGLRKAMGKKNMEAMQKERERFMEGCKKKDIQPALAKKIFDQMEQFASYGFNKSHSVAYALVAYQTAFLKANYPAEFMTAALTSEIGHNAIGADDKENKIVTYLDESRRMGIPVLGPDIQASFQDFSIEDTEDGQKAIRFGLHAVKNVGDEASRSMVATREESGKFKSLHDLCMRIDLRQANRKTLESLSKAGALDSLYPELGREEARARVLADLDKEIAASACLKEEENSGQSSLFDIHEATCAAQTSQEAGSIEPLSEHELLNNEKEVLGFYLSGHPLVRYEKQLHMIAADRISELSETSSDDEENPEPQAKTACIAGIIAGIQKKQSRAKKEPWAQLVVEDLTGRITVNVFPKNYPASANAIKADNIVAIRGRISIRPESDPPEVEIVADEVIPLSQAISRYGRCIKIKISAAAPELKMKELGKLLTAHRGDTPAYIVAELPKGKKALIQTELCVALGDPLFEDLDKTVGSRGWLVESGTPSAAPEKPFRRAKTGK
ncbi:MAG: DNA polymerase III subunit alpha, partial [Elusimicrobiaceae bacterium]